MKRLARASWLKAIVTMLITLLMVQRAARAAERSTPANRAKRGANSGTRNASQNGVRQPQTTGAVSGASSEEVALLKQQIELQQKRMERLEAALAEQKELLASTLQLLQANQSLRATLASARTLGQVAGLVPLISVVAGRGAATTPALATPASSAPAQNPPEEPQAYIQRIQQLSKAVDGIARGVAGFRFSGDLRLRSDNLWRSGNSVAGPLQNLRGSYRVRLNIDKGIADQFSVHLQLGSGRFNNPVTDDTEFGGSNVRGPVFLSEAWVNWHPNTNVSVQAGKMPEVFQDYTRFMWDEDMRFNGTQESFGVSLADNALRLTRVDFRAGQYVLTNPNIQVLPSTKACTPPPPQVIATLPATINQTPSLPANCIYLTAGYQPGENVRSSSLFDQGVFLKGRITDTWSQYLFSDFLLYRNANQIALGSTTPGALLLTNNILGVVVSGPLPGTGNATTIPGGAIYTAGRFQIGRLAYRLTYDGWRFRGENFPVFVDVQGSRNFGTGFLRNAWMATLNAGEIRRRGDIRFLYAYGVKDANSMISQYTDDHFGSNTGVNIRTNMIRFDLGLARFLQWQNLLYIQKEVSGNDPARHFFVPIPAGAATQYRAETQLFANF